MDQALDQVHVLNVSFANVIPEEFESVALQEQPLPPPPCTPPTICVIGPTGTGKSATCNTLLGCRSNDLFEVTDGFTSTTTAAAMLERPWRGRGPQVRCIDCPGLGDSEGRDDRNIPQMVEYLRLSVKQVHVFLVLFNSMEPRLNGHMKCMLLQFKELFGSDFVQHMMIGFTRWDYRNQTQKRRERRGQTQDAKAREINMSLREILGHNFDLPCVFIDNELNSSSDEDLLEELGDEKDEVLDKLELELSKIEDFLGSQKSFMCQAPFSAILSSKLSSVEKAVHIKLQLADFMTNSVCCWNRKGLLMSSASTSHGSISRGFQGQPWQDDGRRSIMWPHQPCMDFPTY